MNYYRGRPQGTMRSTRERQDARKYFSYVFGFWFCPDTLLTLGGTPFAQGTSPPVTTISGALSPAQPIIYSIDSTAGGTARGQATFKWSANGGATYTTGVLTAATTPLATPAGTVTVAWPVGTYNTDQSWTATIATWGDAFTGGAGLTQSTEADRVPYTTGSNGRTCLDWLTSTDSRGMTTAAVSYGDHTLLMTLRGDANSGIAAHRGAAGDYDYIYCTSGASSAVTRGGNFSGKNVGVSWLRDGVFRRVAKTYSGTHATHLVGRNAVQDTTTNQSVADPGSDAISAALFIGRFTSGASDKFIGVIREVVLLKSGMSWEMVTRIDAGLAARSGL